MNKQDYKTETTLESTENILSYATNNNFQVITLEGCLNDFSIIKADKQIKINRLTPRKYIILFYEYCNSWGNNLFLLLTNDDNTALTYAKKYGYPLNYLDFDYCESEE